MIESGIGLLNDEGLFDSSNTDLISRRYFLAEDRKENGERGDDMQ